MKDLAVLLQEEREEELLRELAGEELARVAGGIGGPTTACLNHINPDPLNPIDCDLDDNIPIEQPDGVPVVFNPPPPPPPSCPDDVTC